MSVDGVAVFDFTRASVPVLTLSCLTPSRLTHTTTSFFKFPIYQVFANSSPLLFFCINPDFDKKIYNAREPSLRNRHAARVRSRYVNDGHNHSASAQVYRSSFSSETVNPHNTSLRRKHVRSEDSDTSPQISASYH